MRSSFSRKLCTSAHIGGQMLMLEGQTCSLGRAFTNCGLAIARGGVPLRFSLGHSSRKLGGAHLCRLELMPQFQAHVPNPLRDDLPGFLPSGRVTTPAVGIWLVVFIC